MRLHLLQSDEKTAEVRDELALATCANDIAWLLKDSAAGPDRHRVRPGDIAVLLETHRQVQELRELLIAKSIPVVGAGKLGVLNTPWADDLQLLLHALLNPNDSHGQRGALATRLLGMTASKLQELATDQSLWDRQLARFAGWRTQWQQRGVLAAIEAIVLEQAPRLLASHDGDRALTDLRHLAEVLQEQSAECFGPHELYAWLIKARAEGNKSDEGAGELQLRIESDSQRVQLITIHASKGLQFPVVFVPMTWRYRPLHWSSIGHQMARYHDSSGQIRLDLGTPNFDQRKAIEHHESLQERMRLLYVALTRSELATYLYAYEDLQPSADLGRYDRGALAVLLGAALASCGNTWEALRQSVPMLAIDSKAAPETSLSLPSERFQARVARAPMPSKRPYFGLYSFTSLVRSIPASLEPPFAAEDEGQESAESESPSPGEVESTAHPDLLALQQIKGPRFGNAVHQLLEVGPGKSNFSAQAERIKLALAAEGIRFSEGQSQALLTGVAELLDRTLETELAPGLRLKGLEVHQRRAEFEFAFALKGARWDRLQRVLDRHGLGHWWPSANGPVVLNGLMKGFIDLVFDWDGRFHVLDYKTNFLGTRAEDYAGPMLEQSMIDHYYGLQALVYSVAVHRYLGRRLDDYDPNQHLGEAWYMFVRAVGLGDGMGIWRRRFPTALIVAIDALFEAKDSRWS